jgi:hypothetical protein
MLYMDNKLKRKAACNGVSLCNFLIGHHVLEIFWIFLEKFGQHLPSMNMILEEIFVRKGKKMTLSIHGLSKDDGG